jgi:preprotein translocase subunit YajC
VSVEEDGITVEVDNGVKIKFDKAAVRPPVPEVASTKK